MGISIETAKREYRSSFERLAPAWELTVVSEVDSTMNLARQMAEVADRPLPHCIIAITQSGGRGRQGRQWSSVQGGFYATFVFDVSGVLERLSGFSLVVGAVLADVLEKAGVTLQLKWPNDLITADGRKVGGILIESFSCGSRSVMLVGVGVNFDNPIDAKSMASVRELGGERIDIFSWSADAASALSRGFTEFSAHGLSRFLPRWIARDFLRGKTVSIDCGDRTVRGTAQGVGEGGSLIMNVDGTIEELWSGHITAFHS